VKKILLLLLAAVSIAIAAPAARAFDRDPWRDTNKTLHELYVRMDVVKAQRDRFGASPRLRDEMGQLRFGITDLTARLEHKAGDPKVARKMADNLSDLMTQVESEYRARAHRSGVVIHVGPGW